MNTNDIKELLFCALRETDKIRDSRACWTNPKERPAMLSKATVTENSNEITIKPDNILSGTLSHFTIFKQPQDFQLHSGEMVFTNRQKEPLSYCEVSSLKENFIGEQSTQNLNYLNSTIIYQQS